MPDICAYAYLLMACRFAVSRRDQNLFRLLQLFVYDKVCCLIVLIDERFLYCHSL